MHIVLTGATGFIGSALVRHLVARGHRCTILSRQPRPDTTQICFQAWRPDTTDWYAVIDGADAVVNLAGAPVAGKRWTAANKQQIHNSRVRGTAAIVAAIAAATNPPRVLINASATGLYGDRGDEILTETATPGTDFLSHVVVAWEQAALTARAHGVRVVCLRTGLVLGPNGGALARLLPIFRFGLGGRLGSGRQWMSWIHRADLIGLIDMALENSTLTGPINAVSPNPVTNATFTTILGHLLHRPTLLHVPAAALTLLLGEQSALLLNSLRVVPQQALAHGVAFRYPTLGEALRAC